MFAPVYQQAMKYAGPVRKALGVRTVFNILGPLANPAGATVELMGVYDKSLVEPLARVLANLGVKRGAVVHGFDGLDEITATNKTYVCEINNGTFTSYEFDPKEYGFEYADKTELEGGDLLVVEVSPALVPPVRYRGRTFIRIGPRRDIATESEERVLLEKRTSYMATFDATPCFGSSLKDIDTQFIKYEYLPQVIDADILKTDKRSLQEQLAAIHLYDIVHDCPTNAAIVLFGINASFFLHGCYVQYVHFAGEDTGSEILNERQMRGSLCSILPKLESFVKDAIVTSRPMPVSMLREQIVFNYPELALRELLMNACMHRDYQSNMPIRIYQFSNRIEILNAGGLYGEARPENFPTVNDYRNPISDFNPSRMYDK